MAWKNLEKRSLADGAIVDYSTLLLRSRYGLSDPAPEKQLARDLLFRRFVELDLAESVPDYSAFWRFRQKLERRGGT